MSRRLRIAAIGCGLAARDLHVPAINAMPDAELVGLCDRDAEVLASVASKSQDDPTCSQDAARLLAEVEPDVVLVLTPTPSHEALATLALESGAHVLVEKPFADSAAAARRMAEAAARSDRILSVVHNELFTPGMDQLRRRLAEGEVGEISSVHYMTSSRNQRYVPDPWYFEARGGRIGETLPHALCLLDELLPDLEVRSVQAAHLGHAILPEWAESRTEYVDDLRVELASQDGEALGSIWYSMNSHVPTAIVVAGTRGHLLAYPFGSVSQLRVEPPPLAEAIRALRDRVQLGLTRRLRRLRKRRATAPIQESSHYAQLHHFFEATRGNVSVRPDADSACRVTALWENIVDRIDDTPPSRESGS